MAKGLDFTGATFEEFGSSCNLLPDGTRKNFVQHRRITLADGTQYEFDRYGWHRWMPNSLFRRFPDSRGYYRRCNGRYGAMLNQAWDENYIEPVIVAEHSHL